MKINWGTGIVITIIAFIGFILFFVITMSTGNNYSHDLVTEAYYQKELAFQQEIDAKQNVANLKESLDIHKTSKGIEIQLPSFFDPTKITGNVFLYRPSDKQLDFKIPISNIYLLVPENRLLGGRWNITVVWHYEKHSLYVSKRTALLMLISAILLGLLGSFHCIGMCGPIAFMLPVDRTSPFKQFFQISSYHLGRLSTYAIIGLLFGLLGKGFFFFGFQQHLAVFSGVAMIVIVLFPVLFQRYNGSKTISTLLMRVKECFRKGIEK